MKDYIAKVKQSHVPPMYDDTSEVSVTADSQADAIVQALVYAAVTGENLTGVTVVAIVEAKL